MYEDAALITIVCAMFINIGLSGAIQEWFCVKIKLLSCPKCLTFWSVFLWSSFHHGLTMKCVVASFLCSYLSLWLTLLYDVLSVMYNKVYEKITKTDTHSETGSSNEVS